MPSINTINTHADNPDLGIGNSTTGYVLDRKRIYIFPTRYGWAFAAVLTVMLLGSINYDNSLGFVLTFLLGSLLLVGILHTFYNLAGLSFHGGAASPVFAGEMAQFRLSLDNHNGDTRYAVNTRHYPSKRERRANADSYRGQVTDLPANRLCSATVEVMATQRGLLRLGRVQLSTLFPLGLLRAWAYLDASQVTCLVYPAPQGRHMLPSLRAHNNYEMGGSQYGNDDFRGFRNYQDGDSPRNIAWKALAREQGLLTKRFVGSGSNSLDLSWEQTDPSHSVDARLGQLCRWVLEAEMQGLSYGLELPSCTIVRGSGGAQQRQCLTALALFDAS